MTSTLSPSSPPSRIHLLDAFKKGLREGWQAPMDLHGGYSWPNDPPNGGRNRAFDRGANLGQRLGRLTLWLRKSPPSHGERMAFWEIHLQVRVTFGWIGEGYHGDFNEERLLRFDATDLTLPDPERRGARDEAASYCTLVPASTPRPVLRRIARAIAEDLAPLKTWKRPCQEWSHVDPAYYLTEPPRVPSGAATGG
jgi:hypothetical protein